MSLQARTRHVAEKINALSLRERALLMLALFAIVFLVWEFTRMQPLGARQETVRDELHNIRERTSRLSASLQTLASERGRDPNRELRERRGALAAEIEGLEQRLAERHGGIATSRESVAILAGLLAERAGVEIVALENLPPGRLSTPTGGEIPGLYVHRVRVVIESDYAGIRDYLDRTEQLPRGVFWESLQLDVPDWPTNRIELVLYSISLDQRWLGV